MRSTGQAFHPIHLKCPRGIRHFSNEKALDIFLQSEENRAPQGGSSMKDSKTASAGIVKGNFNRGALFLVLLLAACVIPFALAHRQSDVRSESQNPKGFVCFDCSWPGGWQPGPDMPSTA